MQGEGSKFLFEDSATKCKYLGKIYPFRPFLGANWRGGKKEGKKDCPVQPIIYNQLFFITNGLNSCNVEYNVYERNDMGYIFIKYEWEVQTIFTGRHSKNSKKYRRLSVRSKLQLAFKLSKLLFLCIQKVSESAIDTWVENFVECVGDGGEKGGGERARRYRSSRWISQWKFGPV